MENQNNSTFNFIFFSILGVILFLAPLNFNGESKIFIAHFVSFVLNNLYTPFILFTQIMSAVIIIGSILFLFYTSKNDALNKLFKAKPLSIFVRISGSFFYLVVLNEWFSNSKFFALIIDPDTGGLMAGNGGLLTNLYLTFFIGILILPLLTHFGLVEYIGTLIAPFMVKVFKVPGYSAIDALASFVGDGTIGIVVTDNQYKRGYYSKREAYIIATSFSIVGIAFAATIAEELGFSSIFPIFYLSIAVTVAIIAFITARLPLKKYPDTYYEGLQAKKIEIPNNKSTHEHAIDLAIEQANNVNFISLFKDTFFNIINIYIGFLPVIMFVGTLSLIIAEKTIFFTVLSIPFIYLYEFLGFSKEIAEAMAPATIVGFADMYLPALFIKGVASETARFFIGVLSFTQLLFMSETGMVLLKSSIGVNFFEIIKIFLYRTFLSIPIVLSITYLLSSVGILNS